MVKISNLELNYFIEEYAIAKGYNICKEPLLQKKTLGQSFFQNEFDFIIIDNEQFLKKEFEKHFFKEIDTIVSYIISSFIDNLKDNIKELTLKNIRLENIHNLNRFPKNNLNFFQNQYINTFYIYNNNIYQIVKIKNHIKGFSTRFEMVELYVVKAFIHNNLRIMKKNTLTNIKTKIIEITMKEFKEKEFYFSLEEAKNNLEKKIDLYFNSIPLV